jgi:putative hydrolase
MDPADALERIVYLLDRGRAPGHKVKAFQRARQVVVELPPDELDTRWRQDRLTELPGIGATTGKVIAEALAGGVPEYVAHLERETAIPIGEGAALRAALRGDCHTHSSWSDGGASIETMARAAIALGHEYIVLTDHSPRLTVARGLSPERLAAQLEEVAELNGMLAPFRVLTGMEVDILEDGRLDLADHLLAGLDVVVASVHSKFRMPRPDMTRRIVMAVASPHVDILGHCTGRLVPGARGGSGRKGIQFDPDVVFAACARFGTAVEINCRPERQDPPEELLELAIEWECNVSIDTDAHAPGQLEWQAYGCDKATRLGIGAGTVVNTMAADELVAWAGAHPTT